MAKLEISLFGPFQVLLNGAPVTQFESAKVRALLVYLAAEYTRPHSRENLATLLWPDWPQQSAMRNLRNALADLRQNIGDREAQPPFLLITREDIQLNHQADVWVDVGEFEAKIREQGSAIGDHQSSISNLQSAISLYRGPFLDGFSLLDNTPFEEWLLAKREYFSQEMLKALSRLTEWSLEQGAYEQAEGYARRQIQLEPWREQAHQQLMRALSLKGARVQALAQFESLRKALQRELKVEPSEDTVALYQQIRKGNLQARKKEAAVADQIPARPLPAFYDNTTQVRFPKESFVAREEELEILHRYLAQMLNGRAQVIFIAGSAGQGKTFLIQEFVQRALRTGPNLLAAQGVCNAYSGQGDAYLPFRDVMSMLTGEVENLYLAGVISREHARRLWEATPGNIQVLLKHGKDLLETLVTGERLLSRAISTSQQDTRGTQELEQAIQKGETSSTLLGQSHLFEQSTNVLRAIAEVHPLLITLDDLQWADTASTSLLFHIGRRLQSSRVMILCAYRPEEVTPGVSGERHPLEKILSEFKRQFGDTHIDLSQTEEKKGRDFIDAFLGTESNQLGEHFRQTLFKHTKGHPLFTIELLRAMQERGDLVQQAGVWVEGPALDWEALPPKVEAVIEARISRLEAELRDILTIASVEGEDFTAQVVARVQQADERRLIEQLSQELDKRYWLVREEGVRLSGKQRLYRYRFHHGLFQQYIYHNLGTIERGVLHEEVANVLEVLYAGHVEEIAAQLAYHYKLSGNREKAVTYLTLAGDQARARYANQQAERDYRAAIQLGPTDSERAWLLSGLGESLFQQSLFTDAIQTWEAAINLYHTYTDPHNIARLYARVGRAIWYTNDTPRCLAVCLEGLETVREMATDPQETPGMAALLHETARAYRFNEQFNESLLLCEQALAMAQRLGLADVQAESLATLGILPNRTPEARRESLIAAIDLAEKAGLLATAARAHLNLGGYLQELGEMPAAVQHVQQARLLAHHIGITSWEHSFASAVVEFSAEMGDLVRAEQTLADMRQLETSLPDPAPAALITNILHAQLCRARGDWDTAMSLYQQYIEQALQQADSKLVASLQLTQAEILLESENFEAAGKILQEVAGKFTEVLPVEKLGLLLMMCFLNVGLGQLEQARHQVEEIISIEAENPTPRNLTMRAWAEAKLAVAEKRWEAAFSAYGTCYSNVSRAGMRWRQARIRAEWAQALALRGGPGDLPYAREMMREAINLFEKMQAPQYVARLQEKLRMIRV